MKYYYENKYHILNSDDYHLEEFFPETNKSESINHIKKAIDSPVNSANLAEFLHDKTKILIIVNDGTRTTPTDQVIDCILPMFKEKICRYLVAVGTHRNPNERELKQIFGNNLSKLNEQIYIHDSHATDLEYYGTTSAGNDVFFNKFINWADAIIVIGSCEPHYFAGYTGGRKSFLPGIAGYDTIERNHKLALSSNASILKLKGNPVHEDMVEAATMIKKPIFSIQMVLDINNKINKAVAGDLEAGLEQCIRNVDELFKLKIKKSYDIVIAEIGIPLDRNLYQAHKGIENCRKILKSGGIMILLASCTEGIGNDNFYRLLAECDSPEEVFKRIEICYKLGYHKAAKLAELMIENELYLVSELENNIATSIFIKPFNKLEDALRYSLAQKGKECCVAYIHRAGVSVAVSDIVI